MDSLISAFPNELRAKRLLPAVVFAGLMLLAGCGGSSSSTQTTNPVAITISPTAATLSAGTTEQFTATVTNSTNTAVTWQVNGAVGGSAAFGTITTAGFYTAPSSLPSTAVTVTAVSQADTTKTATASITVTLSSNITVAPSGVTLASGAQQTFTATVAGQPANVIWAVHCQSQAAVGCGTISTSGVYTAPLTPPPGGGVTVTATSQNGSANPANAGVSVVFGTGALIGPYAFTMAGRRSGQPFRETGSISLDGHGGITGGVEDLQGGAAATATITGGNYVGAADGRATATVQTDQGAEVWQMAIVNHNHIFVMRADAITAEGDLELQDTLQFGKALSGTLSFRLSGEKPGSATPFAAEAGALLADGNGGITSGVFDLDDGGIVSANLALSGTSTASAAGTGRGTFTFTSSQGARSFAYYVVSSTAARAIETDGVLGVSGELARQPVGPISVGLFAGPYAFLLAGGNALGVVGQGGTFVLDGGGTAGSGTFDIGTDTAFSLGFPLSGSLAPADPNTGRTVASLTVGGTAMQYAIYPGSSGELVLVEIDGRNATSGVAEPQDKSFAGATVPAISGNFALGVGESGSTVVRSLTGVAVPGPAFSGTLDLNDAGNITLGSAVRTTSLVGTSVFGRGTLNLGLASGYQATYTSYIVDANTVLLLETDGRGALTGSMRKQF